MREENPRPRADRLQWSERSFHRRSLAAELASAPQTASCRTGAWHTRRVIDQLRSAAEALNQGDPAPFASLFAPRAEWRGVSSGHLWWKHTPS
jgi:hypothetical protein